MTTVDTTGALLPVGTNALLAPYGSEITVSKIVTDPATGTSYTLQQGVFRIASVSLSTDASGGVKIDITGDDRAAYISRQRFSSVLTLTSGRTINQAISDVLDNLDGTARAYPRSLAASTYTIDSKYVLMDQDPWQTICDLALAAGQEAYISHLGVVTTVSIPSMDALATPTWTYLEGSTNVVVDVSRTLDGTAVRNGIQLSGTNIGTGSFRSDVYDTSSSSPTNSASVFGKQPETIDSSYVRTQAQATAVAQTLLSTVVGQPLEFSIVPNPAMDVGDVVQVQSSRLGFISNMLVDTIDMPLEPTGVMRVTGRSRTL